MALRLTTIDPVAADGAAPPPDAGRWVAGLAARALAALRAANLEGYRELVAEAGRRDEPQRRYQAQVSLVEQGLSAAGEAAPALAAKIFAEVAIAALDALEPQPSEPLLLNYAGVACYELWSLDGAKALFAAARRLDPGLPNVERNLTEVSRRGRAPRPRQLLHPQATALGKRARGIAGRARPATGQTLSLCMIVRDEEQMLGRCLASAVDAVDEIVVVDTGSRDATVEIARSFGAKVIEWPWNGSFSDARNVSFDAATGDWVMYLDADEVLVADDVSRLRALAGQTWREAFSVLETSFTGELGDGLVLRHSTLRVFRNRPEYRFSGRIHEQIADKLPDFAPGRISATPIRLEHYGYLASVHSAKEKSERNITLLRSQVAEGRADAFLHFNLGCEYAALADAEAAVSELERSWAMLSAQGPVTAREWLPTLLYLLVRNLQLAGRPQDALRWTDTGLELFPRFTDLVLEQATIHAGLGDTALGQQLYERCLEMGDAPAGHGSVVGSGTYRPRLALAKLALERGDGARAADLLAWSLEHHPDFLAAVAPYAAARLTLGDDPGAIVATIEERLDQVTPTVRHVLARTLRGSRSQASSTAAERQYELALDADPRDQVARLALAELLLARAAYTAAATQAAAVPAADAFAGRALRLQLCALIGSEQLGAARAALARAAGLPAVEREVFAAWATIAEGQTAPAGLPAAAVPLLGTILELLLRARDLERFDQLLPALAGSQLAIREQRELLAGLYLEHGYLGPAAQHWMAVCAQAPDVRALLGLARVALAQGMAADAANFATGALELEPGSVAARELLSRSGVDM